jgi:transposase
MAVSLVAQVFGTDRRTIQRCLERYRLEGESGFHRKPGSGRPRVLEALTESELRKVILRPASDFGYETDLWTIKRVQAIIEDRHEIQVSKDTVWRRLREAGLTYQKPERQYYELDERVREAYPIDSGRHAPTVQR